MNSFNELQKLLLRFGTVIYTKDKLLDLELIEHELNELRAQGLIEANTYVDGLMIIKKRKAELH